MQRAGWIASFGWVRSAISSTTLRVNGAGSTVISCVERHPVAVCWVAGRGAIRSSGGWTGRLSFPVRTRTGVTKQRRALSEVQWCSPDGSSSRAGGERGGAGGALGGGLVGVGGDPWQPGPRSIPKYGSAPHRGSFNYPAFTIEARVDRPVRVKWINDLVDRHGRYLPHLLPVDPTLHWANPPGGAAGRDSRPAFRSTPGPYRGPVPTVTHLHGSHSTEESDGFAEAWYLPHATNIPAGYARVGSSMRSHGPSSRTAGTRDGRRGRRCSSTRTTSEPPPCGSTTTPWA